MHQHYELLLLLNAPVAERDLEAALGKVRAQLKEAGAAITQDDPLGTRRLAYPIKKQSQGTYHVFQFDSPTRGIDALERALRLTPEVLRHVVLVTKVRTPEELEREEALRAKIEAKRRAAQARQTAETVPATAASAPAAASTEAVPAQPKVSLEQLDEKLKHILEEAPDV